MAIRKSTFEKLEIPKIWEKIISDDMVLSEVAHRNHLEIQFVPESFVISRGQSNFKDLINWMSRQAITLKVYSKSLWFVIGFLITIFN